MEANEMRIKRYEALRRAAIDMIQGIEFERSNFPQAYGIEPRRSASDQLLNDSTAIVAVLDMLLKRIAYDQANCSLADLKLGMADTWLAQVQGDLEMDFRFGKWTFGQMVMLQQSLLAADRHAVESAAALVQQAREVLEKFAWDDPSFGIYDSEQVGRTMKRNPPLPNTKTAMG